MTSRLSLFIFGAKPFEYESSIFLKTGSLPSPEMKQAFCDQVEADCKVAAAAGVILFLASLAYCTGEKLFNFHQINFSYPLICSIAGVSLALLANLRLNQIDQRFSTTVNKENLPDYCDAFEKYVNNGGDESLTRFFSNENPFNRAFSQSSQIEPSSENNTRCEYFESLRDGWCLIKIFREMIVRNQGNVATRVPAIADEVNIRLNDIASTLQEIEIRLGESCKRFFKNIKLESDDLKEPYEEIFFLTTIWNRDIPIELRYLR